MALHRWLTRVGVLGLVLVWGATALAITAPPPKREAFPHRQLGAGRLLAPGDARAPLLQAKEERGLAELLAHPGAQGARVTLNLHTGLAHNAAYMDVAMEGDDALAKARNFLSMQRRLFLAGHDTGELALDDVRMDEVGCAHVDFHQTHQGLRVLNAGVTVHFNPKGNVAMVNGSYLPDVRLANVEPGQGELSAEQALDLALTQLGDPWLRRMGRPEMVVYARNPAKGGYLLAYKYHLAGMGLWSDYVLVADAHTGAPLAFHSLIRHFNGTASVFDPNPRNNNDQAVTRTITDLDGSGVLRGPLITILDEENPRAERQDLNFDYPVNSAEFRQACVYYYLTETRKRLRALGFNDQQDGAIPAVVNALDAESNGGFNNAFFTPLGVGFVFGNGDGNTMSNLSQDFDVAAHEFGHFFDYVLRGRKLGSEQPNSPRRAWGEAVGDTVAAIINGDPRIGESSMPGREYLRNMANNKRFPNDVVNQEHTDGEIFGAANWDLMNLLGGGTVTVAAREEMARIMIAGIPNIPENNVQFSDVLKALIQGDLNRTGGSNADMIRQAYSGRGIIEGQVIPQSQGSGTPGRIGPELLQNENEFIELFSGIPVAGTLPDSPSWDNPSYADFFIRIPAGATRLRIETFAPGAFEIGDVVLLAAPSNFTSWDEVYYADNGYIYETIEITNASPIPLNRDSVWLIEVMDYPDFQYSEVGLVATIEGGDGTVTQIMLNQPVAGTIPHPQARDLYAFSGNAGQVIDVAVDRATQSFDPFVILADARGQILAVDDDSGGDLNARIAGFTLPLTDYYLVAVQSAMTAQGPFSSGPYSLLVSTGTAPLPTNTPGPPPDPSGAVALTSGEPLTRAIEAGTQQNGGVGTSEPFKVTVPPGAQELIITAQGSAVPRNSIIVQARRGQPVDPNSLDDVVGLGSRRSAIVLTPDSRTPIQAGDYYIQVFNIARAQQNFTLTAQVAGDEVQDTPTPPTGTHTFTPTQTMPPQTPTVTQTPTFTPVAVATPELLGDLNADGVVDHKDLLLLMSNWMRKAEE